MKNIVVIALLAIASMTVSAQQIITAEEFDNKTDYYQYNCEFIMLVESLDKLPTQIIEFNVQNEGLVILVCHDVYVRVYTTNKFLFSCLSDDEIEARVNDALFCHFHPSFGNIYKVSEIF